MAMAKAAPFSSGSGEKRPSVGGDEKQGVEKDEAATTSNEERENILTVPNLLCLSRIALSPYIAHLIIHDGNYPWALAVFGYAGITDALDGWIARNVPGQMSSLGSFLDPLSDKVLMTSLYLSLTYVDLIPSWLTSLVVSRDLFLVYAGLYVRYMSVQPPVTLKKYLDFSIPTAQVNPTTISKINTLVQLALVGVALCAPVFDFAHHPAFMALCGVTACTTFASAVSYAFFRDVYTFKNRAYEHHFGKKLTAFVLFILFNVAFVYNMPKSSSSTTLHQKDGSSPLSSSNEKIVSKKTR